MIFFFFKKNVDAIVDVVVDVIVKLSCSMYLFEGGHGLQPHLFFVIKYFFTKDT